VAHRTADVVDNAAFLVVDRALDTLDLPVPSGGSNIDVPQ